MAAVKESVLVNVFEMFVKRLDELTTSVNALNEHHLWNSRYLTNGKYYGTAFRMPFEIRNYLFEKGSIAHVYIHFKGNGLTLYDMFLDIWQTDKLTGLQAELREFAIETLGGKYADIERCIRAHEEDALCCSHYNIDTCYEDIIEYLLNLWIKTKIPEFRYFNHVNYGVSIWYDNGFKKDMYIDELINDIVSKLSLYGFGKENISYIQVVKTCEILGVLNSYYDFNGDVNETKRNHEVQEYLSKLGITYKKYLHNLLEKHYKESKSLPLFFNENDYEFVMSCLRFDL